jgi:predicted HD phosphohydrolase
MYLLLCLVLATTLDAPGPSVNGVIRELELLFATAGEQQYYHEPVTHVEHALQCATLAEQENHDADVVVASFLHDVGHIAAPADSPHMNSADGGYDVGVVEHEVRGREWLLSRGFHPRVGELVESHVASKRYLVATNATYFAKLADDSVRSLVFQGGPMNASEVAEFERRADFARFIALRSFDERGKVSGMRTPPLAHFIALTRAHLERVLGLSHLATNTEL